MAPDYSKLIPSTVDLDSKFIPSTMDPNYCKLIPRTVDQTTTNSYPASWIRGARLELTIKIHGAGYELTIIRIHGARYELTIRIRSTRYELTKDPEFSNVIPSTMVQNIEAHTQQRGS
jgi:hypothetical protein